MNKLMVRCGCCRRAPWRQQRTLHQALRRPQPCPRIPCQRSDTSPCAAYSVDFSRGSSIKYFSNRSDTHEHGAQLRQPAHHLRAPAQVWAASAAAPRIQSASASPAPHPCRCHPPAPPRLAHPAHAALLSVRWHTAAACSTTAPGRRPCHRKLLRGCPAGRPDPPPGWACRAGGPARPGRPVPVRLRACGCRDAIKNALQQLHTVSDATA